jgi:hypothetical protein
MVAILFILRKGLFCVCGEVRFESDTRFFFFFFFFFFCFLFPGSMRVGGVLTSVCARRCTGVLAVLARGCDFSLRRCFRDCSFLLILGAALSSYKVREMTCRFCAV